MSLIHDPHPHLESLTEFQDTKLEARIIKDGVAYSGEVIHNDLCLFVVNFQRHQRPSLPLTEKVEFELTNDTASIAIRVPATVIYRRQDEKICLYQFQLDRPIDPGDHDVLSRRRAPRVCAAEGQRIAVELSANEGATTARAEMLDISTLGAAVILTTAEEQRMCNVWSLRMRFDLPGLQDKTIDLNGEVRYRRLIDMGVRYGIEFSRDRSFAFQQKQALIETYVLSRQPNPEWHGH